MVRKGQVQIDEMDGHDHEKFAPTFSCWDEKTYTDYRARMCRRIVGEGKVEETGKSTDKSTYMRKYLDAREGQVRPTIIETIFTAISEIVRMACPR